jgi:hypothetical protein
MEATRWSCCARLTARMTRDGRTAAVCGVGGGVVEFIEVKKEADTISPRAWTSCVVVEDILI